MRGRLIAAALVLACASTTSAVAGEAGLERRVRELERQNADLIRRLEEVERRQQPAATAPVSTTGVAAAPAPVAAAGQGVDELPEETTGSGLGLHARYGNVRASFQIFGDAGFGYRNPQAPGEGKETAFAAGSLDLFTNAQLGEHFQTLSEIVLEGDSGTNELDFELERLWGAWIASDELYLKLGREHSPLSMWNRRYHHGKWLWTSATQPFLARFEDDGGPLPVHQVGLEVGGRAVVPWGTLDYVGVVANGRGREADEVQNVVDHNTNKALDVALSVVPAALPGVTIGASVYLDEIPSLPDDPTRRHAIGEVIETASLFYFGGALEALGEIGLFQHDDRTSGRTFQHYAGYLQLGYHLGRFTPFGRIDARDMERGDPFFAPDGIDLDEWEPALGLRYDVNDNVAVKLEVAGGRTEKPTLAESSSWESFARLALQLAWVF
jgi:hypothetical protein